MIFLEGEIVTLAFFTPRIGMDIIINAAKQLCNYHLKSLREFLADSISTVRLSLTTGKNENILTSGMNLNEVIMNFYVSTVEKVKGVLQDLTVSPHTRLFLRRLILICIFVPRFSFNRSCRSI